jgi:hypothetical protein
MEEVKAIRDKEWQEKKAIKKAKKMKDKIKEMKRKAEEI